MYATTPTIITKREEPHPIYQTVSAEVLFSLVQMDCSALHSKLITLHRGFKRIAEQNKQHDYREHVYNSARVGNIGRKVSQDHRQRVDIGILH